MLDNVSCVAIVNHTVCARHYGLEKEGSRDDGRENLEERGIVYIQNGFRLCERVLHMYLTGSGIGVNFGERRTLNNRLGKLQECNFGIVNEESTVDEIYPPYHDKPLA